MRSRGKADRLHDARIGAAAADVAIHQARDVLLGRVRVGLQQADRGHHHPGRAVAALEGFGVEERLLHGMQAVARRASPSIVVIAFAPTAADARDARARAGAVEQHRAGAALPFAAAVAAAGQAEVVAEDRQQAVARLGVNLAVPCH